MANLGRGLAAGLSQLFKGLGRVRPQYEDINPFLSGEGPVAPDMLGNTRKLTGITYMTPEEEKLQNAIKLLLTKSQLASLDPENILDRKLKELKLKRLTTSGGGSSGLPESQF